MVPWQKFGLISSWKWCCLESISASMELDLMCAVLARMNSGGGWQLLRAELSPFFSDWMWITSRRLARRMLPQPWLWGGEILYRYAMESDLFLSRLCYPPMCCHQHPNSHWGSAALSGSLWLVNQASGMAAKGVPTSLTLGIERFLPRTAHRFFYALCHTEWNTLSREFL